MTEKKVFSMDFENETWKEIEGYGGRYQISNYGRLWNVATQSMMKPQLKKTGYLQVNLMKPNKKMVSERVHRLVALYFCEKPDGCNVVNHIDSNKTNNNAENLEWTTVSGNTKHCYEHNEKFRKQVNENAIKAAQKTILTLKVKDKDGFLIGIFKGYQNAAEALGVNEKTVRNIMLGKFKSNRKGYIITAIAKGGDVL
jgi:hypothetical protein